MTRSPDWCATPAPRQRPPGVIAPPPPDPEDDTPSAWEVALVLVIVALLFGVVLSRTTGTPAPGGHLPVAAPVEEGPQP